MFTGPYGISEDGAYSEYLAVREQDLGRIPDNVDDVSAGGLPVAYLTAYMTLHLAGFKAGQTVLATGLGGSVGNAVAQLARALGAKHVISTTSTGAKAQRARSLGFEGVIDSSVEPVNEGVRRITGGAGVDIIIDGIGGNILSEALGVLSMGGSLTTLGYAAGRKTTIDVTDLIWKAGTIRSFMLFAQPAPMWKAAWDALFPLFESGAIKPIVARTFPLEAAADAMRCQIEDRPFGRIVLGL